MAQLVGQLCVLCHERIGSILDGQFCLSCGCPIHEACAIARQRLEGTCAACSAPVVRTAPRHEVAEQRATAQSGPDSNIVLRYVLGVLLFGGFVVFVTPTELAVVLSLEGRPGDPGGLMGFGITCVVLLLGLPGYFLFPSRRRLQAVGWLSLACMGYSLMIFGLLHIGMTKPGLSSSPETRDFLQRATIRFDRLAAISAVQLAVWALLFRRKGG